MTLDGAVFKNVWVACEGFDDEKVHCNKCIIAGASEVGFWNLGLDLGVF